MPIVLLSAVSGVGKTTACQRIIMLARGKGLRVAGLLSLPMYRKGEKVGIRLHNISNGEEYLLARAISEGEDADVGMWKFDPVVVSWGQEILAHLPPCDLLVIDEIGPLELIHNHGLTNGLAALRQENHRFAITTIRPELVEKMRATLENHQIIVINITKQNRQTIPMKVIQLLETKETI